VNGKEGFDRPCKKIIMERSKIIQLLATLTILFGMSSCVIVEDDYVPLPCEYNNIGTICFQNDTGGDVYVSTGPFDLDVWAYSRSCIEVPAGVHGFFAQSGGLRWDGTFDVFTCDQSNVFLSYK